MFNILNLNKKGKDSNAIKGNHQLFNYRNLEEFKKFWIQTKREGAGRLLKAIINC